MNQLIINSEEELKQHFEEHEKYHDSIMDKMLDVRFDDRLTPEYEQLSKSYDESRIGCGEFGLSYGKIEMYWSHEGAVLENVKFCPFCGVNFIVQEKENKN